MVYVTHTEFVLTLVECTENSLNPRINSEFLQNKIGIVDV